MSQASEPLDRRGLSATIIAFLMWGVFPLYWHLLKSVPAFEIIANRIVWAAMFLLAWLFFKQGNRWWRDVLARRGVAGWLAVSSVFIAFNWGLYIWAVNAGHVVETSLGYFINPLVNVVFGVLFLHERLNPRQWSAIAIAAAGVLWLTLHHDGVPWIALSLAFSFAIYGLIRKQVAVDAVPGLAIESVYLLLPAIAWLFWQASQGSLQLGHSGIDIDLLLILGGGLTALPLIGFAYGARRIPFTLIGMLQYIAPTLQLLIGVWVFSEPFDRNQLIGFAAIWVALAIYAVDGVYRARRNRANALPAVIAETATLSEQKS
ncbi:MAG: EamA family transporter RarD [Dokdonella sp.]